jgi:hypothetical protein
VLRLARVPCYGVLVMHASLPRQVVCQGVQQLALRRERLPNPDIGILQQLQDASPTMLW